MDIVAPLPLGPEFVPVVACPEFVLVDWPTLMLLLVVGPVTVKEPPTLDEDAVNCDVLTELPGETGELGSKLEAPELVDTVPV